MPVPDFDDPCSEQEFFDRAIPALTGFTSEWVARFPVTLEVPDGPRNPGSDSLEVQEYALTGHPEIDGVYAWRAVTNAGYARPFIVFKRDGATTAELAVRSAIIQEDQGYPTLAMLLVRPKVPLD